MEKTEELLVLGMSVFLFAVKKLKLRGLGNVTTQCTRKGAHPFTVFPGWGKTLAFLLLFEAVAKGEPVYVVYWKATRFAFRSSSGFSPSDFFGEFLQRRYTIEAIVQTMRKLRPDLFAR